MTVKIALAAVLLHQFYSLVTRTTLHFAEMPGIWWIRGSSLVLLSVATIAAWRGNKVALWFMTIYAFVIGGMGFPLAVVGWGEIGWSVWPLPFIAAGYWVCAWIFFISARKPVSSPARTPA